MFGAKEVYINTIADRRSGRFKRTSLTTALPEATMLQCFMQPAACNHCNCNHNGLVSLANVTASFQTFKSWTFFQTLGFWSIACIYFDMGSRGHYLYDICDCEVPRLFVRTCISCMERPGKLRFKRNVVSLQPISTSWHKTKRYSQFTKSWTFFQTLGFWSIACIYFDMGSRGHYLYDICDCEVPRLFVRTCISCMERPGKLRFKRNVVSLQPISTSWHKTKRYSQFTKSWTFFQTLGFWSIACIYFLREMMVYYGFAM